MISAMDGAAIIDCSEWRVTEKQCMSLSLQLGDWTVRVMQRKEHGTFSRVVLIGGKQHWKSLQTKDPEVARDRATTFLRALVSRESKARARERAVSAAGAEVARDATLADAETGAAPSLTLLSAAPNDPAPTPGDLTLRKLMDPYKEGADFAENDERTRGDKLYRMEILLGSFGEQKLISRLDHDALQKHIQRRREGGIEYVSRRTWQGKSLAPRTSRTRPVRDRSTQADMQLLRAMILWAMRKKDDQGRPYLSQNPMEGFQLPVEKNPVRSVATYDRYLAIRAKLEALVRTAPTMLERRRWRQLLMVLDMIEGLGRRIGAVRQVRLDDLRLDAANNFERPFIRWREDADKDDRESVLPITSEIARKLRDYCEEMCIPKGGWLIPHLDLEHGQVLDRPMTTDHLRYLLEKVEMAAGLTPLKQGKWHAYRRKFATERKGLPIKDVMQLMGIRTLEVFMRCYMQTDETAQRAVIEHAGKLRDGDLPQVA